VVSEKIGDRTSPRRRLARRRALPKDARTARRSYGGRFQEHHQPADVAVNVWEQRTPPSVRSRRAASFLAGRPWPGTRRSAWGRRRSSAICFESGDHQLRGLRPRGLQEPMSRLNRESSVPSWHFLRPLPTIAGRDAPWLSVTVKNKHSVRTVGYGRCPEASKNQPRVGSEVPFSCSSFPLPGTDGFKSCGKDPSPFTAGSSDGP
jgi:hypothetical protein